MNILPNRAAGIYDQYEDYAQYNLADSYAEPLTLDEIASLTGEREALMNEVLHTPLDYRFTNGSPELHNLIAGLYSGKSGDDIMISSGAINANLIVLYGLIQPNDHVVVMCPNYRQLYAVPDSFGARVDYVYLKVENDYKLDLEELKAVMNGDCKMLIMTNPNNPTGVCFERQELEQIVALARSNNSYLLCDEIYKGYLRPQTDMPAVAELYEKGITTCSLSKVYSMSGLRLGWIVATKDILEKVHSHRNYSIICCNTLSDIVARYALKHYDKLVQRNTAIVESNLAFLHQWLESRSDIAGTIPKAGTFVLLKYKANLPSVELCDKLFHATGVFIMPGSCFDMEGYIRVCFAIQPSIFQTGLQRMGEYLDSLI